MKFGNKSDILSDYKDLKFENLKDTFKKLIKINLETEKESISRKNSFSSNQSNDNKNTESITVDISNVSFEGLSKITTSNKDVLC